MSYILCSGGLGNQMFQYAFYKSIKRIDPNANFDISYFKHNSVHQGYELERCFGITDANCKTDHFNIFYKVVYSLMSRCRVVKFFRIMKEHSNFDIRRLTRKEIQTSIFNGYWQGEKFFQDVNSEIKKDFMFNNLSPRTIELAKKIRTQNSIAIHVRRGDYLKSSAYVALGATKYYYNVIKYFRSLNIINPVVYVFSDDISWCQSCGIFDDSTIYVDHNKNEHSYEDMYLMSQAKMIAVANSSFSWWAGYLGNHEIVLRPEKYLNDWNQKQDSTLFPSNWICVEL